MNPYRLTLVAILAAFLLTPPAPTAAQAPPAPAQTAAPSAALTARINGLLAVIKGEGDYDGYFHPAFRAQVTKAQFDAIARQLTDQLGAPTGVASVTASSPNEAVIQFGYERGIVTMRFGVEAAAPNRVNNLLITGTTPRNDNAAQLEADFRALPGFGGFGIYALDSGVVPVRALNGDRSAPLGSGFKLWVLAELARQVRAGERRWSDVVPIGAKSLPGGMTQAWPDGAPITLHSLATLMISISDNTATDTLITVLGRDKVDAMIARAGVTDPARSQPLLTTLEAFRLKALSRTDPAIVADWATLTPAGRRAILTSRARDLAAARVEAGMFAGGPLAQQVEWFGSPADMARTFNWLRREGGEQALAIMAVNPGTSLSSRFDYVGFKGGSEPGVITLNYLVRNKSGKWFAVAGHWHRPDAAVETATFAALMNRVLAMVPAD